MFFSSLSSTVHRCRSWNRVRLQAIIRDSAIVDVEHNSTVLSQYHHVLLEVYLRIIGLIGPRKFCNISSHLGTRPGDVDIGAPIIFSIFTSRILNLSLREIELSSTTCICRVKRNKFNSHQVLASSNTRWHRERPPPVPSNHGVYTPFPSTGI